MTDFARLVLASDTTGLRDARSELNRLTRTGAQAETKIDRSMRGMGNSYRMAAAAAAGLVAAAASIGAALRGSQEIQQITNSLRALGMSTDEAGRALDDIAAIADRTRAPLTATAQLFQRVTIAGRDLGASRADVLRFTENVGLALGATGISAQEASGALLQLSQAMAGGVVRAEEFNSILEGAFPIAQAAADGIDGAAGSVGRLRQMVVAGEVSSREFFEAIISQSDALQDSFDQTEQTIGQATQGLMDSFNLLARETDKAFGISSGIAAGIDFLADNLELVRAGVLGTAAVITGMYLPAIVTATSATLTWVASLITLRGALIATGIGAIIVAAGTLIDFLLRLRSATGSWGEALAALGALAAAVWDGIKTSASALPPALGAIWADIQAGFFSMIENIQFRWYTMLIAFSRGAAQIGLDDLSSKLSQAAETVGVALDDTNAKIDGLRGRSEALRAEAASLATQGFDKVRQAAADLMAIVNKEADATSEATTEAQKLAEALDDVGGGDSGGGAAGRAAKGMREASDSLDKFSDNSEQAADNFARLVRGILEGTTSIGDALQQIGGNMLEGGLSGLFKASGIGDLFGGLFAGAFDGGGMIPSGKFGIVGERGPEIVTGPAQVTSRAQTARIAQLGGGQAMAVTITMDESTGAMGAFVRDEAGRVVAQAAPKIVQKSVGATFKRALEHPIGRR